MEIEKTSYTHRQMTEMISRTRSWTLNNPSGGLPYLPAIWREDIPQLDNLRAMYETIPPYKNPHKLIKLLIWLKLI